MNHHPTLMTMKSAQSRCGQWVDRVAHANTAEPVTCPECLALLAAKAAFEVATSAAMKPACEYCGTTQALRISSDGSAYALPVDHVCADCFTSTDEGPSFDDLPLAAYPAYHNGLTIEVRDGRHVVTNDFGGRIVFSLCDGLDDALMMRERYGNGFPAEALKLQAAIDASKNRAHAAKLAIIEEFGEEPFRIVTSDRTITRYTVMSDHGQFWGEATDDEASVHAVALERLLSAVRASVPASLGSYGKRRA